MSCPTMSHFITRPSLNSVVRSHTVMNLTFYLVNDILIKTNNTFYEQPHLSK
jgi:hypothetical protein